MNAIPAKHFAIPPYKAEMVGPSWAGVMNAQGFNCLTFPDKPGAIVTDLATAEAIAKEWNKK